MPAHAIGCEIRIAAFDGIEDICLHTTAGHQARMHFTVMISMLQRRRIALAAQAGNISCIGLVR